MSVRHNIRHAVAFWDEHDDGEDGLVPAPDDIRLSPKPGFKIVAACGCGWRAEAANFNDIAASVGFHTIAPREDDGPDTALAVHDEAFLAAMAQDLADLAPEDL